MKCIYRNWLKKFETAISIKWSGEVVLLSEKALVGTIVVIDGRIAWATSEYQTEKLGSILQRYGKIEKQHIRRIRRLFYINKGKRSLGSLLKEHGHMDRQVLRRCLLLQIREAISSLISRNNLVMIARDRNYGYDEGLTFTLDEVLARNSVIQFPTRYRTSTKNSAFTPPPSIMTLAGYRGLLITDDDGDIVAEHTIEHGLETRFLADRVQMVTDRTEYRSDAAIFTKLKWTITDYCDGAFIATCYAPSYHLTVSAIFGGGVNLEEAHKSLCENLAIILVDIVGRKQILQLPQSRSFSTSKRCCS